MAGKPVTAKDLENWYSPVRAREIAAQAFPDENSEDVVWSRISRGLIRTYATTVSRRHGARSAPTVTIEAASEITAETWLKYDLRPRTLWRGEAEFVFRSFRQGPDEIVNCFGIKLDPEDVHKHIGRPAVLEISQPPPSADALPIVAPKHAGGAPGKDYWDDLWAAMAALVYKGQLNPASKQRDIEEAMVKWAADHRGDDLSVPTARIRARKLLAELRKAEEDKN